MPRQPGGRASNQELRPGRPPPAHASRGWVEVNDDLNAHTRKDPWFGIKDILRESSQLGKEGEVDRLKEIGEKLGGSPPGCGREGGGMVSAVHRDLRRRHVQRPYRFHAGVGNTGRSSQARLGHGGRGPGQSGSLTVVPGEDARKVCEH